MDNFTIGQLLANAAAAVFVHHKYGYACSTGYLLGTAFYFSVLK